MSHNETLEYAARLRQTGNPQQALDVLDSYLSHNPPLEKRLPATFNRSLCLQNLKRYHEALQGYVMVVEHSPNYFLAWVNAGDVLNEMGQYDAALKMFEHALDIAPKSAHAKYNAATAIYNMSQAYKGKGDVPTATKLAKRAVEMCPTEAKIAMGLAELYLMVGNYKDGWALYESRFAARYEDRFRPHIELTAPPDIPPLTALQLCPPLRSPLDELLAPLDDEMQHCA